MRLIMLFFIMTSFFLFSTCIALFIANKLSRYFLFNDFDVLIPFQIFMNEHSQKCNTIFLVIILLVSFISIVIRLKISCSFVFVLFFDTLFAQNQLVRISSFLFIVLYRCGIFRNEQYRVVLSANKNNFTQIRVSDRSLVYMINKGGQSTDPYIQLYLFYNL